MVKVDFMGPIDSSSLELDVHNLHELKVELQKIPDIAKWLDISAVAVNNTICTDINTSLNSGDSVVILPPVCGG